LYLLRVLTPTITRVGAFAHADNRRVFLRPTVVSDRRRKAH